MQEDALFKGVLAFLLFSVAASAIYVLNDLKDIEEDRAHPTKCERPIASGRISRGLAWNLFFGLGLLAILGAYLLSETLT